MYLVMGITAVNVGSDRPRGASAEAGQTGASPCAQSRESGEVGRPGRGVGGWRLERCDSHCGGAQRRCGRVCDVAGCMGSLARLQRSKERDCELCRGVDQGSAFTGGSALVDGRESNQAGWG